MGLPRVPRDGLRLRRREPPGRGVVWLRMQGGRLAGDPRERRPPPLGTLATALAAVPRPAWAGPPSPASSLAYGPAAGRHASAQRCRLPAVAAPRPWDEGAPGHGGRRARRPSMAPESAPA